VLEEVKEEELKQKAAKASQASELKQANKAAAASRAAEQAALAQARLAEDQRKKADVRALAEESARQATLDKAQLRKNRLAAADAAAKLQGIGQAANAKAAAVAAKATEAAVKEAAAAAKAAAAAAKQVRKKTAAQSAQNVAELKKLSVSIQESKAPNKQGGQVRPDITQVQQAQVAAGGGQDNNCKSVSISSVDSTSNQYIATGAAQSAQFDFDADLAAAKGDIFELLRRHQVTNKTIYVAVDVLVV
jgi:hypothetical protein